MSIFDLTGRVAVITGGNGGIGLGIAQALNAARLQRLDLGPQRREERSAAATMAAGPGKVDTRVCDVTDPASGQGSDEGDAGYASAASTAASPMPASAAADGAPSSTAPRRNGERCSRPISTACSTCSRPPRAT